MMCGDHEDIGQLHTGQGIEVKEMDSNLVEVTGLRKYYPVKSGFFSKEYGTVYAVDDVSFTIRKNETLGLVGESGCGKSTLGKCLLRAVEPTGGSVRFHVPGGEAVDLVDLDKKRLRGLRPHMQMIFQDPYSSLDPRMTVMDIISEPLILNYNLRGSALNDRVSELIKDVGLEVKHLKRYPHAFSGGQRQRIGIARALAMNPTFIVADEAVSALDVSVQAQILNLLKDLQEKYKLTYLFIAHNLSVVEHISDRVAVMYVGRMVEVVEKTRLFANPLHPYSEALLSAMPIPDPTRKKDRIHLPGEVASAANLPEGCYFHPRCRYCTEACKKVRPDLREVQPGHFAACHRAEELSLRGVGDYYKNEA